MCRNGNRYFLQFFYRKITDPIAEKKERGLTEGPAGRQDSSSALGSAKGF